MPKDMDAIPTGNHKLIRHHIYNPTEQDIDVPDGNVQFGKQLFRDQCGGCHYMFQNVLGPMIVDAFGRRLASVPGWRAKYSNRVKGGSYRWSKQKLYIMLQNPELVFGLQSAMTFWGQANPYARASIIEYLMYIRVADAQKALKYHQRY